MSDSITTADLPDNPNAIPDYGAPHVKLEASDDIDFSRSSFDTSDHEQDGEAHGPGPNETSQRDSAYGSSQATIPEQDGSHHKHSKLRALGHKAKLKAKAGKDKTKRLLDIGEDKYPGGDDADAYKDIAGNPAFDPEEITGHTRLSAGGTADKVIGSAYASAKAVLNPRNAVKRKAATKVAIQDRPYMSQQADLEFLQAHEDLSRAESSQDASPSDDTDDDRSVKENKAKVESLEALRQSRKVAWITSKHMYRVRVVPNVHLDNPPCKDDYYVLDKTTGERYFDWKTYLAAVNRHMLKSFAINRMGNVDFAAVPLPAFDRDVTLRYVERIVIASSPWQSWFADLRELYRWENPKRTGMWAAIWFVIWWQNYCMTFVLLYTVYIVLENKYRRKRVDSMRDSYQRAVDGNSRAFRFTDLINKHGHDKWIDPLIEEMGPIVQMQLSDLADFLEILNNFYDWKLPGKTWGTLFWFATAISIGALAPTGYSWKIICMFTLLSFFLGRPIASKHPQYRHVINALKWIFWDIPTDPVWSMMYLRERAQETRARVIGQRVEELHKDEQDTDSKAVAAVGSMDIPEVTTTAPAVDSVVSDSDSWHTADSSSSIMGGIDLLSFRCRIKRTQGRLKIFSDGLRFVRASPFASQRKEKWRRRWQELVEMQKVNFSTAAKMMTMEGIRLEFIDGTVVDLEGVKRRDRAFNCILGFSGLQFQVMQPTDIFRGTTEAEEVQYDDILSPDAKPFD